MQKDEKWETLTRRIKRTGRKIEDQKEEEKQKRNRTKMDEKK